MVPSVGLVVCETVFPEIQAVVKAEGWDDVQVMPVGGGCLRGFLRPQAAPVPLGAPAPADMVLHQIRCACGPKAAGNVTVHDQVGGRTISNPFQLFLPGGVVDGYISEGAYLATSGWIGGWEGHLEAQGLSLDGARQLFQEFARSVVLVDTGVRDDAVEKCQAFSRALDLPYTVVAAGLHLTRLVVRDVVQSARIARQALELRALRFEILEERAKWHLVLALQQELSSARDEEGVLERIRDLFTALFAPGTVVVASLRNQEVQKLAGADSGGAPAAALASFLRSAEGADHRATEGGDGFMVRFRRSDTVTGGVLVSGFLLPERHQEYLNLTVALAPVCELVLSRARALGGLLPVCSYCHQIRDSVGAWSRFEDYITERSDALFSHSVCPDCMRTHYPDLVDEVYPPGDSHDRG